MGFEERESLKKSRVDKRKEKHQKPDEETKEPTGEA
jgi:hypothetical protein